MNLLETTLDHNEQFNLALVYFSNHVIKHDTITWYMISIPMCKHIVRIIQGLYCLESQWKTYTYYTSRRNEFYMKKYPNMLCYAEGTGLM